MKKSKSKKKYKKPKGWEVRKKQILKREKVLLAGGSNFMTEARRICASAGRYGVVDADTINI